MSSMLDGIKPGVLYVIDGGPPVSYAITPDGEGMYFYDTREEALENLPENPDEDVVTHEILDIMRGLAEPHHGHFGMSQWWCDTCDSPYCELA